MPFLKTSHCQYEVLSVVSLPTVLYCASVTLILNSGSLCKYKVFLSSRAHVEFFNTPGLAEIIPAGLRLGASCGPAPLVPDQQH